MGLLALQRYLTFPRHVVRDTQSAPAADVEQLWLETAEGRVEAWLLPGRAPGVRDVPAGPGPLVMFAHGNGELIDHWPAMLAPYQQMGVSVLLPEYRGYGRSAGTPSEEAIAEDFAAFYDMVTARPEIDRARVVFHGRSMGGGAVCALAARRPPAALILQSTFTSLADVMRRFGVPRLLVVDKFDNLPVLDHLEAPVLVVHGESDALIPPAHARKLAARARQSRIHWFDGGHNDPPPHAAYWGAVRSLLRDANVVP